MVQQQAFSLSLTLSLSVSACVCAHMQVLSFINVSSLSRAFGLAVTAPSVAVLWNELLVFE